MASATLNSLVALSKPAVSPSGSSGAGAVAGAGQTGASVASASGGSVAAAAAPGTAAAAPATIGDFLAMLSEMIDSPATTEGAGVPAGNPVAVKPDGKSSDSQADANQLLAQLLAFMQGGSTDGASSGATTTGAPAGDPNQAAVDPASAGSEAGTASALLSAFQAGAAGQKQLIAKLLGQAQSDGTDSSTPAPGTGGTPPQATDDKQTLANTLQSSFQNLLSGRPAAGSDPLQTLQDLTTILGQANAAGAATQPSSSQVDPSALQSAIAAAAAASAAPTTSAPPTDAPAQHLQAPVGSAAWRDQLGTHLTWMASNDQQSASLKLTPPHLGPLEIQITVGDDNKASVWFSAPHADTRAALGDALPRLRELFGAGGLTLADANVSREPSRQNARSSNSDSSGNKLSIDSDDLMVGGSAHLAALHAGILDTYA